MPNQVTSIMGKSQTHFAGGAKVNDPGGHTTAMETGGTIPG